MAAVAITAAVVAQAVSNSKLGMGSVKGEENKTARRGHWARRPTTALRPSERAAGLADGKKILNLQAA